jgi:Cu/Ag efflux pump CusA
MMRWIVGKSLKARRLMVAIAAALIAVGVVQLRSMPVDVLPEFEPPTVEVQTEALGLSAAEVEEFITVPLEQDLLNGVAFLKDIRSASLPGLSSIQMVFEPGTKLLDARQVVQERLAQAQTALPNVQTRPSQMLQPLSSTSRVMMIALSSDRLSQIDLSILTRWTIGPRLLGVPGVANVAVWGFRDRQLQVLVDPARLRERDVRLQQVIDTAANSQFVCPLTYEECSTPGTGGIIETPNQRVGVQYVPVTATPEDLADVPLEGSGGRDLALGDIAQVVEDHQPLIGDSVGPDLLLVIQKFPAANTLEVSSGLEEAIDALRPGLSGVQIDASIYRPASYIEQGRDNLGLALLIGALLALIALLALLFDWRSALTSVISIAASLAVAVTVLSLTGATLNTMTIAGLVLALVVVVDDAVTDVEDYARRIHERRAHENGHRYASLILGAALEMRSAGAYALMIALVSIVPVFFTTGPFGTFFPPIARSFALAVSASMVVALLFTPAIGLLLLAGGRARISPVFRALTPRFRTILSRAFRVPAVPFGAAAVLAIVGLAALPFLSRATVPAFKDTNLLVHLGGAPSTSLAETQRISRLVAEELRTIPGVDDVGAHVGRAIASDQVVGANAGQVWLALDPAADYDATVSAVEQVMRGYPGIWSDVVTYPNARIDEIMPEAVAPVVVRLYGQDLAVLNDEGERVRTMLAGIDGVVAPQVVQPVEEPTLEIEVDLAAAQEHGIRPGDVRRAATTMISGITVGSLFEDQKVFEVVVWGVPEVRSDLTAVQGLLVDTPGGGSVRVGDVADVRIAPGPIAIRHQSVSRYMDIVAQVSGRDLAAVLDDVHGGLQSLVLPIEYHAEIQVEGPATGAGRRAVTLAVAAALLIFLLLQVALGSWRLATLGFAMLPLALTGGVVAMAVDGGDLSLGSVAGLFATLAIAVRQLLTLMSRCRNIVRTSGTPFDDALVIRGATERLRPVLTTAICAGLALLPVVVAGSIAGLEVVHPLAVVVIGGLITTTLVVLIVAPLFYARYGNVPESESSDVSVDRLVDLTGYEATERVGGGR